ncbi:MAG: hypothetical protein ACRBDI_00925 [Alphaproteobacteria bacterium]
MPDDTNILSSNFRSTKQSGTNTNLKKFELLEEIKISVRSITDSNFDPDDITNLIHDIETNITNTIESKQPETDKTKLQYKVVLGTKGSGAPERAHENYHEKTPEERQKYIFLNKGTFGFIPQLPTFQNIVNKANNNGIDIDKDKFTRELTKKLMGIDELIADVIALESYEKNISIVRVTNAKPDQVIEKIKRANGKDYDSTICFYHTPLKDCALNYNDGTEDDIPKYLTDTDFIESYVKNLNLLPLLLDYISNTNTNLTLVYHAPSKETEHSPIIMINNGIAQNYVNTLPFPLSIEKSLNDDLSLLNEHDIEIEGIKDIVQKYLFAFNTLISQENGADYNPDLYKNLIEEKRISDLAALKKINQKHKNNGHSNKIIELENVTDDKTSTDSSESLTPPTALDL